MIDTGLIKNTELLAVRLTQMENDIKKMQIAIKKLGGNV